MRLKMNPLETLYIEFLLSISIVVLSLSIIANVLMINIVYLLKWIFKIGLSNDVKIILFGMLIVQINIYVLIEWISHFN